MNIHLKTSQQSNLLAESRLIEVEVGSKLYGINNDKSDTDRLSIFAESRLSQNSFVWTHNQYQYKTEYIHKSSGQVEHMDFLYCSLRTFIRNILTGDSTMNYEVLYSKEFREDGEFCFLHHFRFKFKSYQLLRSYLGLARRDLKSYAKGKDPKKLHHALRGLWAYKRIYEDSYTNEIEKSDPETFRKLMHIKNGAMNDKDSKDLYTYLLNEVDLCRKALNDDLDNGKIQKMMSVPDMMALDRWLMEFCDSKEYKEKQTDAIQNIQESYDSLFNNVTYCEN